MEKKKATPKSSPKQSDIQDKPNATGKLESMLYRFACGKKFHRFSAERVGDHCLPTTISDLQISLGLKFDRKFIKVPNRFGSQTAVKLYWLEGDNLIKARRLIGLEDTSTTNHQKMEEFSYTLTQKEQRPNALQSKGLLISIPQPNGNQDEKCYPNSPI